MKRVEAWQARKIQASVGPMLDFLRRLHDRMLETGFPHDHPVVARVTEASATMEQLHAEVEFLAQNRQRH